jgi:hypothetical protein
MSSPTPSFYAQINRALPYARQELLDGICSDLLTGNRETAVQVLAGCELPEQDDADAPAINAHLHASVIFGIAVGLLLDRAVLLAEEGGA